MRMILGKCIILFNALCTLANAYFQPNSALKSVVFRGSHVSLPRSDTFLMAGGQIPVVPYYPTKGSKEYQWMDIYNALGRDRTLFVGRFLDDESANQLIASLIWLQGKDSSSPITLYFNVPGAIMKPAMAVFDVMRRMTCPIITINMGLSVGMGAVLCAVGTPGKRFAFPNARFLMARTGIEDAIQGQASDLSLAVAEVMKDNEKITSEIARLCGQPVAKVENDLRRDFYLTAAEAAAYGVIDFVMVPNQPVKMMKYRGDDDEAIGFGHFCEVRPVKEGPTDTMEKYKKLREAEFDDYAAKQMAKKGFDNGRPDPKFLKSGVNRFANSRCKPPGAGKIKGPVTDAGGGGNDDKDKFKNTGF